MAYNVAICDDSAADAAFVENILRCWAAERRIAVQTDVFPSAESFMFHYAGYKDYDILLLDIEMGGMDGVTMARRIRAENESVEIIFITGYSEYIAEGYEVAALHYLMKPVGRDKLYQVLDRAAAKLLRNERCLMLEQSGETARIPFYEIRFAEVRQNYVTIHAKADYTAKMTLSELEGKLDERFFRAGRSYLINLDDVQRVTRQEVHLAGGMVVPLPRGYYDPLNRAIIKRN